MTPFARRRENASQVVRRAIETLEFVNPFRRGPAFGGVHWRTDNIAGLQLGEAVAIGILADDRRTVTETFKGFSLTKFDGTTITI